MKKLALVVLVLAASCRPQTKTNAPLSPPLPQLVTSNVARADYAGSRSCQPCHAELYRSWLESPMHNMTRLPSQAKVNAPFTGEQWRFKKDLITFESHDGERYMRLDSAQAGTHLYRITKIIGGHHREDFAGVEVKQEPGLPPVTGVERVMPANFMISSASWRYKGYSVMTPERPGLRPGAVWSKTCIFCHNTEPYLSDLFGALAGPSTPPYQGEVVDALLSNDKRWQYRITDENRAKKVVADEIAHLGGNPGALPINDELQRAVKVTRAMFDEKQLVELGIGCESCHGGSVEHVKNPDVRPSLEPRAPWLAVEGKRSHALDVNHVCARCHQVLFTQYPWTWEGESRKGPHPGGAHINSGEGRDLMLGDCASEMSCVSCHDPHAHDNREKMAVLDGPKGSEVCVRCHDKYATAEAVRAHTHHDPAGAGGQCMNCHMPKKNMSLENGLGRYHRVGSPTEQVKVEGDRPLECALCHADKTVEQLVTTMESWWHKSFDRQKLIELYGSLDANPIRETLRRGKPHEQAVALAILGERKDREMAPLVAQQLTHGIPLVRYFADRALAAMIGRPTGIDLFQENAAITAQANALLSSLGWSSTSSPTATTSPPDSSPASTAGED